MVVGYIDLSKRRVSPEDIVKCEERFMKSKTVASILRHVASKVPSLSGSGDAPTSPIEAAVPSEKDRESKKAARKARQAAAANSGPGGDEEGAENDLGIDAGAGGGYRPSANEDEKLEQLYEQVGWPLGKKYGHPYDAFKLALTYVIRFFPSFQLPDNPV